MGDRSDYQLVLTTAGSIEQASSIARELIERRLAACVNIVGGACSVYRWKGAVEEDAEALVIFKTTASALSALKEKVLELHSYEVPEFLALHVAEGHLPYLEWVAQETIDPDME